MLYHASGRVKCIFCILIIGNLNLQLLVYINSPVWVKSKVTRCQAIRQKKKCSTNFFFGRFFFKYHSKLFLWKRKLILTETGYDMIIFRILITLALCKHILGFIYSCSCHLYTQNIMWMMAQAVKVSLKGLIPLRMWLLNSHLNIIKTIDRQILNYSFLGNFKVLRVQINREHHGIVREDWGIGVRRGPGHGR